MWLKVSVSLIKKKAFFVYTGKFHASKSFWKIYPVKSQMKTQKTKKTNTMLSSKRCHFVKNQFSDIELSYEMPNGSILCMQSKYQMPTPNVCNIWEHKILKFKMLCFCKEFIFSVSNIFMHTCLSILYTKYQNVNENKCDRSCILTHMEMPKEKKKMLSSRSC